MLLMTDLLLIRESRATRDPTRADEWTIHNALLEAHTVYAKALYAFFFQERNMADDAVASDYVADWNRNRPDPAAALGSLLRGLEGRLPT